MSYTDAMVASQEIRLRFAKVYVEITSACNRACSFCPPLRRPSIFLSVADFQRILEQVVPFTKQLFFHVKGEPLVHPQLAELLALTHEAGLTVQLVTNGSLLGQAHEVLLGSAALRQVNVSLHGFEGDASGLDEYWDAVSGFARASSRAAGPVVSLRFWRSNPNPELLSRLARDFDWTIPEDLPTLDRRGYRLAQGVYVNFEREFVWPALDVPLVGTSGFCLALRDQMAVLADGTVIPCCLDAEGDLALGNLLEQDLASILASGRALSLYRGFTQRRCAEALCQHCEFRTRFDPRPRSVSGLGA